MGNGAGTYSILYVDDELQNLYLFRSVFEQEYTVHTAESGSEALRILGKSDIRVLLVDQRMPGISGIQLLETVAREYPETVRVLVTGYSDIDVVIDAINRGAVYRYLSKPWDVEEVRATIRNALELYELRGKNQALVATLDEQNRLLRKKVAELNFLNKLQLELKGLPDFESITDKAILRLQEELEAEAGCHCESRHGTAQIRFAHLNGDREDELRGLIDQLDLPPIETPQSPSMPEGRSLCVLPLMFQGTSFGHLVFLFSKKTPFDIEELPFAEAASHVVSSVLYSEHVHRQEMKKERLLLVGQMAGMIVHDLKGPLATIMGFVSLMQADLGRSQREEFAGIINQEALRLIDMAEELLSFSKGETHLNITSIEFRNFVEEIVELFDISLKRENIRTEVSLNGLHSFSGDRKKLKKVFINLFQNAREHLQTVEGRRNIWISSSLEKDRVLIRFINNGPRIPEELLPRLFDPFFSHEKDQGTGLGLTICKKIVEEHHGTIEAFSRPGRNEFRITLPVK